MSKNYQVQYGVYGHGESLQMICHCCEIPICIIANYKPEIHDVEIYCLKCLPVVRNRLRNLMGAINPNVN